ncbi:MAG: tetratricopeptide repeat protein [Alphaproteobacteria bacterium]|nr:tetratricopeptide repeat protein [Alphaproteobacteria bacterium]
MMRALLAGAVLCGVAALPAPAQAAPAPPSAVTDRLAGSSAFEAAVAEAKSAMMGDPELALSHAREAGALAETIGDPAGRDLALAAADWLQAEALGRLNRPRDARPLVDAGLALVEARGAGTKLNGDLLMTRAAIAATTGEVSQALSDFQQAHNIFQKIGAARSRAIALQNIGSIYSDAGDYERVLQYYEQSAEAYGEDPALNLAAANNRGNALKELGRLKEAEAEFQRALEIAKGLHSGLLEVRILNNIASAQLLDGQLDAAEATAEAGLKLATGPSAGWAPFLWGVEAQVALARNDLPSAAAFIERAFAGVDLNQTTMPFREFHKTAHQIFKARGEAARALAHLEAFKRLDDEARDVMSSTNTALMAAQFDFANQQLNISNLKAGQLERDARLSDTNRRFLYTALFAAGLLSFLSLYGYFSIRQSRNQTREANESLNAANTALEAALRARTEFLAMTSHELRTPLNGILGMTQFLLGGQDVPPALREHVETIHGAGKTMKALVDDILDVARIEKGELHLSPTEFDPMAMLREIVQLWSAEGARKGVSVELAVDEPLPRIVADEQRLRQIVFNLVANAVKFTEAGWVRISARAGGPDAGAMLVLDVADTGIGIPKDKTETIFGAFQQVDASISRRFGGSGLGLAICRNLARIMGGDIGVTSELGVGSTFRLRVPYAPASAAAPGAATASRDEILLAIANPLSREVLRSVLTEKCAPVRTVDTPAEMMAASGQARFRHAVLDGELLPADALAAMAELRTLCRALGDIPVSLLWPAGRPCERIALTQCGVRHILQRPVATERLVEAVLSGSAPAAYEAGPQQAVAEAGAPDSDPGLAA